MKGLYIFESSLRSWLEPDDVPDLPKRKELTDYGICVGCGEALSWDGKDDTKARCDTPNCVYNAELTEEENRRLWKEWQS